MITTRYLKASDVKQLHALGIDRWHREFIKDDHFQKILALEDEVVVGVAALSITLDTANIDFIFVKESVRSKGVGASLMGAILEWAKEKSADGVGVNCGADNRGARKFYKRHGFIQTGRVFNYFSNKKWQVFFWRSLKS